MNTTQLFDELARYLPLPATLPPPMVGVPRRPGDVVICNVPIELLNEFHRLTVTVPIDATSEERVTP